MTVTSNDDMVSIMDYLTAGIARLDATGRFVSVNQAYCDWLGYSQDALLAQHFEQNIDPTDYPDLKRLIDELISGKRAHIHEKTRCVHRTGQTKWAYLSATRVKSDQPQVVFVVQDITQLVQQQQTSQLASLTFDNSGNGILVTDANDTIIQVNPAFTRISGYSAQEIVGRKPFLLRSGEHDESFYNRIWKTLQQQGFWQGEICYRHRSGELFYVWESISAVTDSAGDIINYVSNLADMSELKRQQQALDELANYDALTQLPNRHYFQANLTQAIEMSKRHQGKVAVMFININQLKSINDRYNYGTGDLVLGEIARRIEMAVRDEDTAARFGGDEFVVLMPKVLERDTLQLIAERLLESIAQPIIINDSLVLSVTASIGVSIFPDDLHNSGEHFNDLDLANDHEIVELANQAMYAAKEHELPLCFCDQLHHFAPLPKMAAAN